MNRNRMLVLAVVALVLSAGVTYLTYRLLQTRLKPAEVIGNFVRPESPGMLEPRWEILLLPAFGALVSGIVVRAILGSYGGQGTDQLVHAFHHENGRMALPAPALKAAASVGVISTGGSAGPEGPISALGAALGSSIGRALGLEPREVRLLLVAGCAAGVGAVFGCPLGGALVTERGLYRQPAFEAPAIVWAFVASAIGYSTFASFWGTHTGLMPLGRRQVDETPLGQKVDPPSVLEAVPLHLVPDGPVPVRQRFQGRDVQLDVEVAGVTDHRPPA